ncbi:hypothetical protein N1851_021970 [Merluccius polli]|uniref:SCAN box domain-containing protein n=1 Tax=Merluccius polli TaxID=89951 RepID=A0AA47MJ47_MERPO|nr:hypothetical protein N1851_021970 [Merluccius polli]
MPSGGVSPAPTPKSPERSKREHDFRMQELQVRREELAFHREFKLKLQSHEQELASQMELAKLHLAAKREGLEIPVSMHQSFDVARNIKRVTPFNERESKAHSVVKSAILRAYELVPEAYRLRFRRYHKTDRQTFVEFAREKEMLFRRWCTAQNVTDHAQLCQLILIEEFKDCLPEAVAMYNEQWATTLEKAAVLADEYVLTHKVGMRDYKPRKNETAKRVNLP